MKPSMLTVSFGFQMSTYMIEKGMVIDQLCTRATL